jgi:hypothetical protein
LAAGGREPLAVTDGRGATMTDGGSIGTSDAIGGEPLALGRGDKTL